jgi:hypothetical protein
MLVRIERFLYEHLKLDNPKAQTETSSRR